MLKSLLRVRFAALLAAFTGQSRKRGRQTKGKAVGYALLMLYCFCAFVFLFYSSFSQLAEAFFPAGLGWLFFAMFAIMAFALMFIGSVFTAKSQLFEAKDNELLLSMPVRPGLILLSRMAAMLAMNFVFELVVALPVFAAWLRFGSPDAAGIAAFVLIVLALPLFALAVSCLFAWLISLLTSRMRNTTVITMVLSVVFLLAYFVFCFRMNTYVTQLAANGQAIAGALGAALPLVWLGRAAAEGNLACLGLTLLWTILPFALAYVLLARSFIRIVTTNRGQIRVRYEKKAMHASSQDAALYRRELARLTSSSGYMLNAGLGLVFELALAVLAVVKRQELLTVFQVMPALKQALAPILLLAGMLVSGMVFFTASSVSLEGKQLWLAQSLPVSPWQVLRAKLRLQLLITIPPMLLCLVCLLAVYPGSPLELLFIAVTALSYALLMALLGLFLGLKMPNLSWTNEVVPIKQSACVALSLFSGWAVAMIPGALYLLTGIGSLDPLLYLSVVTALLLILSAVLSLWVKKIGSCIFASL